MSLHTLRLVNEAVSLWAPSQSQVERRAVDTATLQFRPEESVCQDDCWWQPLVREVRPRTLRKRVLIPRLVLVSLVGRPNVYEIYNQECYWDGLSGQSVRRGTHNSRADLGPATTRGETEGGPSSSPWNPPRVTFRSVVPATSEPPPVPVDTS